MTIALVYGSTTGNTELIAESIRDQIGAEKLGAFINVADASAEDLQGFDVLILGVPTWNTGELQDDWISCHAELEGCDFSGTKIAVFGLGDAAGYPLNFQDGAGILYRRFIERGAQGGFGFWPTEGYDYEESLANIDGDTDRFCGLALDEDNESEKTAARIEAWVAQIKSELALA